ncbi:MAG TPA: metallophosphoesterase [Gemmatimonadaceae bacterium]|nr:metallophosphoesterase [Gemmatimonadaceae bacterium]
MTRRRRTTHPDALEQERRDPTADRRDDRARRKIEMVLDRVFRPTRWAARAAWALGLQSARPIAVARESIVVQRATGAKVLRIAFASDFHVGATTDERVLRAACDAIEALEPDVLLLGGDFVSVRADDIHALAPLLAAIRAPLGKFGVFGNHDLRANRPVVAAALRQAGVRMLVNETLRLPAPHDDVTIIGFDDPIRGAPNGELLAGVDGVRVLLMHAPDGLLAAGDEGFDLALCGHTHGGQIVMPGGAIPYLPHGELSRSYPGGSYRVGEGDRRALIVSRGVGCSTVPVRVLCGAEVHLITLSPSE